MNAMSVSEVNSRVKALIDGDETLAHVLVRGELSGYRVYPSGHHYFTLKDSSGVLKSVMFKSDAVKIGFKPCDGMSVLASGRVTVYPRDGAYQLYCQRLLPDGAGALQAAYEELKGRLEAEGLFDREHKKELPFMPERIVLVTSPAGAAVQDIIRILGRRWPLSKVILIPVRVQGEEAPGEIAAALRYANRHGLGEVIITGRGGGSLEDLWAFNDERVARAIFASHIPVISAVGHEPDFTIADYVADIRAATPSHAAEIAVPDLDEWLRYTHGTKARLSALVKSKLRLAEMKIAPFAGAIARPGLLLADRRQRIDRLYERLLRGWSGKTQPARLWLADKSGRLEALSPENVLRRGYAVVIGRDGRALRRSGDAEPGQKLEIILCEGRVSARVEGDDERTAQL